MLRVIVWIVTVAFAIVVDRLLLMQLPVWGESMALLAAVGFAQGGFRPLLEEFGHILIQDWVVEVGKGILFGFILATAITVARALFGWAPGPLVPSLVWPTLTYFSGARTPRSKKRRL